MAFVRILLLVSSFYYFFCFRLMETEFYHQRR
jgi:hypothetical protein